MRQKLSHWHTVEIRKIVIIFLWTAVILLRIKLATHVGFGFCKQPSSGDQFINGESMEIANGNNILSGLSTDAPTIPVFLILTCVTSVTAETVFLRNSFPSLLTFSLEIVLSQPRRRGSAPVVTSYIWVFTQSFPGAGRKAVTQVRSRGFKGADVNVSFRHFFL